MKAITVSQIPKCSLWPRMLILSAATLCMGCGNDLVPVTGKLLLNGEPLSGASVTFNKTDSEGGRPASGFTKEDGTFQLTSYSVDDGLVPGEYKITVRKLATSQQLESEPGETVDVQMLAYQASSPASPYNKDVKNVVPDGYGDVKTTPFSCKIPPEGELVFDLDSSFGGKKNKKR